MVYLKVKNSLYNIYMVAKREYKHLIANKLYLFTNSLSFLIQIFVYAFILSFLIEFNYTEFYAIGMAVLTLWSFSMFTAWSVAGERQSGMIDYYLSLPSGMIDYYLSLGSLVKSAMVLDFLIGIIDIFMIRLSTAYYPEEAMVFWMKIASRLNPLTHATDIIRDSAGVMAISNVEFSIIYLIIFSICLMIISIKLYVSKLEGGKRI
ncbi:MAG: hypothetical protein EU547_03185 [Promethearchaeota archaeon]|nr:MAG: hypothetical protein EU547_03185 [Candidatus Lokiarchaeota archaeon]